MNAARRQLATPHQLKLMRQFGDGATEHGAELFRRAAMERQHRRLAAFSIRQLVLYILSQ
jgi:hypothetical protein